MHTYNRRPFPIPGPAKAFLDPELDSIARALKDTQAAIPAGSTVTQVILAADVSNSSSTTNQATGLKGTVASGKTYCFRWTVFLNSNAHTGGATLKVTHPTYSAGFAHVRGNSTSGSVLTDAEPAISTSPSSLGTAFVTYSGSGLVIIEHLFTAGADGTVELTMNPTTNTQNYTVKAGSLLEIFPA